MHHHLYLFRHFHPFQEPCGGKKNILKGRQNMPPRGLQIQEGGNGENWEGPQFDPVVRRVEPESLSSLGAREPLPARASKMA